MTPAERIRKCLLIEEMNQHKDAENRLGLKNRSCMQVEKCSTRKVEMSQSRKH